MQTDESSVTPMEVHFRDELGTTDRRVTLSKCADSDVITLVHRGGSRICGKGGGAQRLPSLKTRFGISKGGGAAGGARPLWPSLKTLFGISKGGGGALCAPPPESASGTCIKNSHSQLFALENDFHDGF